MDDKDTKQLRDAVDKLGGDEGWNKGGDEDYMDAGDLMLSNGIPVDVVVKVLTRLYWAAASEYGA